MQPTVSTYLQGTNTQHSSSQFPKKKKSKKRLYRTSNKTEKQKEKKKQSHMRTAAGASRTKTRICAPPSHSSQDHRWRMSHLRQLPCRLPENAAADLFSFSTSSWFYFVILPISAAALYASLLPLKVHLFHS
jgi:hypothetical protein